MSPDGDFIQCDCRECNMPLSAREFIGKEFGCNQGDWSQAHHNMIRVHCLPWNPAMHTNVSSAVEMFRSFIDFCRSCGVREVVLKGGYAPAPVGKRRLKTPLRQLALRPSEQRQHDADVKAESSQSKQLASIRPLLAKYLHRYRAPCQEMAEEDPRVKHSHHLPGSPHPAYQPWNHLNTGGGKEGHHRRDVEVIWSPGQHTTSTDHGHT